MNDETAAGGFDPQTVAESPPAQLKPSRVQRERDLLALHQAGEEKELTKVKTLNLLAAPSPATTTSKESLEQQHTASVNGRLSLSASSMSTSVACTPKRSTHGSADGNVLRRPAAFKHTHQLAVVRADGHVILLQTSFALHSGVRDAACPRAR